MKILNSFKLLTIFAKKLHHRCPTWLKIGFSGSLFEILRSFLFSVCKLSRGHTQPENMCDIVFEKAQGCAERVNKTSVMQKQPFQGFFKKGFFL